MLTVGVRVVRGPNWCWASQDDGEGHCGTVVEVGKPGSSTSPDKTVVVQWDSGVRTNYRVGYQGGYDLCVIDNAPAGVRHPNIICDGCQKHGIWGMRWKCETCFEYDLCTQCYMADKHDLYHVFQRFETENSIGIQVPIRSAGQKIPLRGIFVGAKVTRGKDWEWSNQDGGDGKTGRVLDIRGWENESGRSVANVSWTSANTNVYRVGHKGMVDLKYLQPGIAGTYYKDHLPVLGIEPVSLAKVPSIPSHLTFCVGDKVKVLMSVENLRPLHEGHGGWNPKMADCVGKIGTVHRVTDKGDIRVQYGLSNRWTFHPLALTKVCGFAVGDSVRLTDDVARVRELQKDHGDWTDAMKQCLGKIGKVKKVYKDGDLRVNVDGQTWTLNPLIVTLVPSTHADQNNAHQGVREERESPLTELLSVLHLPPSSEAGNMEKAVIDAAQGRLDRIKEFFTKNRKKINHTFNGKTCLQVACHQGHREMVYYLLETGADVAIADADGDSALHYAAFGDQPAIINILVRAPGGCFIALSGGADVNAVNKGRCTALHVAVTKQHVGCVRALLVHKCNPNLQDSYGDTALHDAIGKDSLEITELLTSCQGIDLTLRNHRGYNVIHDAALRGNNSAMEKLLSSYRQLVDVKKDDGFAALHLACLNGHRAVAETLLDEGGAQVDLRNNKKQTPLIIAASQGLCSIVELLVSKQADINAIDEDGSSALHLVITKRASISTEISEQEAPTVFGIFTSIASDVSEHTVAIALACYLVEEGCSLSTTDSKGKTPLDLLADTKISELLQSYVTIKPAVPEDAPVSKAPVECGVCSELAEQNVLFEPCGHRVACEDCASRVKKCLECGQSIARRVTADGRVIVCKTRQPSAERLRYLETKIQEIEEAHCCSICMERKRNVAFLCGHGACEKCSQTLKICHMCRKTITKKINLY